MFLISVIVLLVYSNTFGSPFVFDDWFYISDNPLIRDMANFWPPAGTRYLGYLSFALNYRVGGLDVTGFHLVNTAIHIFNSFFVYLLVSLTLRTPLVDAARINGTRHMALVFALAPSLLYAAHPVNTEAVTYITQRFASLVTSLYLLSLLLFIKWRLSGRTAFYVLSIVCAFLAQITKEISFTLPFVILLYDITFFSRKDIRRRMLDFIPFALVLCVIPLSIIGPDIGLTDVLGQRNRKLQLEDLSLISRYDYLMTQFRVIVTYLRLLVFPYNQNLDYDYPMYDSLATPGVLASFLFLFAAFISNLYLYARALRSRNLYGLIASFGILWFFITLSIESSIIPIRDLIFEHRLYLPGIGAAISFSAAVFYLLDRAGRSIKTPVAAASVLFLSAVLALGVTAHARNAVWKNEMSLYSDIIRKSPGKARGYLYMGIVYNRERKYDEAIEHLRTVIKLQDYYPVAHYNLGFAYAKKGLIRPAAIEFETAIKRGHTEPSAHFNLGIAYAADGRFHDAVEELVITLTMDPAYALAHYNLARVYVIQGRESEALMHYRKFVELTPGMYDSEKMELEWLTQDNSAPANR